jgi:hypothetical protein
LRQHTSVDLRNLLANNTKSNPELPTLSTDVSEDASKLHTRRVENARRLLNEDVTFGDLDGAPVSIALCDAKDFYGDEYHENLRSSQSQSTPGSTPGNENGLHLAT